MKKAKKKKSKFWGFKKARGFVRGLGLKSYKEWIGYCKSDKKPNYLPIYPYKHYEKHGWKGMNYPNTKDVWVSCF